MIGRDFLIASVGCTTVTIMDTALSGKIGVSEEAGGEGEVGEIFRLRS